MISTPARLLLLSGLALSLAACHDTTTSPDTMHGPENVLQAPVLDKEANHQFDKVNSKLYEAALEDSMFMDSRFRQQTPTDSAPGQAVGQQHESAVRNQPGTPVTNSNDSLPAEKH